MRLHSRNKSHPSYKINNFFPANLERINEESDSQIRAEDEPPRRALSEDSFLAPRQIIFQSTLSAYKYLHQYDTENFSCYKHLFEYVLKSGQRFERGLHDLYAGVMMRHEELSTCGSCNLFSLFFKESRPKSKSLTEQFIESFLALDSLNSKSFAQKYCDAVNKLVAGELALVPVGNAI